MLTIFTKKEGDDEFDLNSTYQAAFFGHDSIGFSFVSEVWKYCIFIRAFMLIALRVIFLSRRVIIEEYLIQIIQKKIHVKKTLYLKTDTYNLC